MDVPPVGVLAWTGEVPPPAGFRHYLGVSFCDALRLATPAGAPPLAVDPSSIQTCRWSPVVLGLKPRESYFERRLVPSLPAGTKAVLLAKVGLFREAGLKPDVVVLRASAGVLGAILSALGTSFVQDRHLDVDRSMIRYFRRQMSVAQIVTIRHFNALLNALNALPWWHRFTATIFKSQAVSMAFDAFLKLAGLADMSVCRNSVVIPMVTGKANVSSFCAGGIAWGRNRPDHMTAGLPWALYERVEPLIVAPGGGPA